MPERAPQTPAPDHVVPASEIGAALTKITSENAEQDDMATDILRWENAFASTGRAVGAETVATLSELSCPDRHGVLSGIDDDMRYRCRVGHAWTAEALLTAQGSAPDRALRTALRTFGEKTALSTRMARNASERGNHRTAERYERGAGETTAAAEVLRQQVMERG